MAAFSQIFISVFFVFGLYCAAIESARLIIKIYRYYKKRRIDKKAEKR